MLAAIVFQSPYVAWLLLIICGLLLGYALSTGRMQDSDTQASLASWRNRQAPPSPGGLPASDSTNQAPTVESAPATSTPVQLTTLQHSLAIADEERSELLVALESAHEELAALQDDLDSHRRALETIERYRNEAQEELARERDQVAVLQARLREYEDVASRVDASHDELAELRGHNAYLQSQLAAALEAHRTAELEWKTAHGEAGHYQDQVEKLQQQYLASLQDAETVRADREPLLASLRSAQEQNRQLTQQIGDLNEHSRQLNEELEALYIQRAYWEAGDEVRLRLDAAHEPTVPAPTADALRVRELEELVGTLREQLRLVQLQAQELVQRQQEHPTLGTVDSAAQLERDRRELVDRIRQQGQQDEAA